MHTIDWKAYCADGTKIDEQMVALPTGATLRVITFSPAQQYDRPVVLFVAGWVSHISGWQKVLQEMTRDFTIHYVETREKISAQVQGKALYSVEEIAADLVAVIEHFSLQQNRYIMFGSSLGATAIVDCWHRLEQKPQALVLVGPNAEFRVPLFWRMIVRLFWPGFYPILRPVVKWYLRTFRLDLTTDRAQYEKYSSILDVADPWKLRKGVLSLARYKIWPLLPQLCSPVLLITASRDKLHEPENLRRMHHMLPQATLMDFETNSGTHTAAVVSAMRDWLQALD